MKLLQDLKNKYHTLTGIWIIKQIKIFMCEDLFLSYFKYLQTKLFLFTNHLLLISKSSSKFVIKKIIERLLFQWSLLRFCFFCCFLCLHYNHSSSFCQHILSMFFILFHNLFIAHILSVYILYVFAFI